MYLVQPTSRRLVISAAAANLFTSITRLVRVP
jgi:hypothetical protein